jgi:hypothetical protein
MWLFFDGGFVSIVEDTQSLSSPRALLVRARAKVDLENFLGMARSRAAISTTPANDYRFRASVTRKEVAAAIALIATRIDYSNFKDQVRESQGIERAHIYGEIWAAGLQIDDRRRQA